jgi:NSS family neurotransmitter:Na+ symporter
VSAVLLLGVFAVASDRETLRAELGALSPLVRYVTPAVLVVVTGAKLVGVGRPAWRLLVDAVRVDPVGGLVAVAALAAVGTLGWLVTRRRRATRQRE